MTAGLRLSQPKPPEWLHSGRYFLLALALHVVVLLYPLTLAIDQLEVTPPSPLTVSMQEKVSAPPVLPPARPAQTPKATTPPREKPAPAPRPVIAMAPEQTSAPAAFSVPAPAVAPPSVQPAPASLAAPPAAAISAVRFDAAYLHNPHPPYPQISRRIGEEGKVLLKVRVTADGRAATVDIEKSSNFPRLDEAARQSVAQWRFVPAKRGDEAVEASVIVPIVFRLEN